MKRLLIAFAPLFIAGQDILLARDIPQAPDPVPPDTVECLVSVEGLKQAAENGDDESQTELAKIYFRGDTRTTRNVQRGAELLSKAAQKKNQEARIMLGACYCAGVGTNKDYLCAVDCFRQAASDGYSRAFLCLYAMYRDGCGVSKNNEHALQWLQRGVDAESPEALCEMAILKFKGALGSRVDRTSGLSYLRHAGDVGSARAISACSAGRDDTDVAQAVARWNLFRPSELIYEPDVSDCTLRQAASDGDLPLLNYLLELRGDTRLQGDGDALCALTTAAKGGFTDIVLRLIACGVDPNERDTRGTTALIAAADAGRTDMVKTLLDNGAKKDIKSRTGETPLAAAQRAGATEIIKLLGGNLVVYTAPSTPVNDTPSTPAYDIETEGVRLAYTYLSQPSSYPVILADRVSYDGNKTKEQVIKEEAKYISRFSSHEYRATGHTITYKGIDNIGVNLSYNYRLIRKKDGALLQGSGVVFLGMKLINGRLLITTIRDL